MQLLDWRPPLERWLAGQSSDGKVPLAASMFSLLAGRLADDLACRRAVRRHPPPSDVLVVSVGNLRIGGTGKTPVVLALARELEARGFLGAVLLRGYGSRLKGPWLVEPDDMRASDEARLLAAGLASGRWSVMQARRRQEGLARLLGSVPRPDLILLEDGYQTAGVGRHLDVLILDAWTVQDERLQARAGAVLPFGPYRETARGADRAHVWLLEIDDLSDIPFASTPATCPPVFGFTRQHVLKPGEGSNWPGKPSKPRPQKWGLLAGLARPERFEAATRLLMDEPPMLTIRCGDHCAYNQRLVERILAAGDREGVTAWATTQKDWIKLHQFWPADKPAYVVAQTLIWLGEQTLPDVIEERLLRMVRKGKHEI